MIIPLVGLFIACGIFACIGTAVLTVIPHLGRTLSNVGLFVIGAVPSSGAVALVYGRVFGNQTGELHLVAVFGLFSVLLVAGLCGGLVTIAAYRWLLRAIRLQREAGSTVDR